MRSAMLRAQGRAAGADGWTWDELAALPECFWDRAAGVFEDFERKGKMPQNLCHVETVLLQKPGRPLARDAIDLRPISVAPLIVRAWAKVRAAQVMAGL